MCSKCLISESIACKATPSIQQYFPVAYERIQVNLIESDKECEFQILACMQTYV